MAATGKFEMRRQSIKGILALLVLGSLITACGTEHPTAPEKKVVVEEEPETPSLSYSVVAVHNHDSSAYTEGLYFDQGKLFESTGAASNVPGTRSTIGIVDRKTGQLQVITLRCYGVPVATAAVHSAILLSLIRCLHQLLQIF